MAQFFAPPDRRNEMYGGIGSILGSALGGLGQYAASTLRRPGEIEKFKKAGATDEEANVLVDMPPAQQMQFFNQKMKQAQEDKKRAGLGDVLGIQKPTNVMPNQGGNLNNNLEALSEPQQGQTNRERRDAAAASGLYDLNEMEKIDKMLGREDAAKENRLERQENRTERQQKLQRKDIHDTTKQWKEDSKKADEDLHALEEMKILRENPEDFTPSMLRRGLTKLGFGEYFKNAKEEAYGKITEGLVMDAAAELASTGKMTAALLDRVRLRFPSLENTPEGAEVVTNILGRKAEEKKVRDSVYNELRKQGGWKKSQEPIDILEQVEEIAEPIIEQMRKSSNEALKKEIGYTENDEAVDMLNEMGDPSKMPEGRIAKNPQTQQPMAKIVNGKWQAL